MKRTIALLLALVVLINAHGWINSPMPRGYVGDGEASASQNGPCGKQGDYPEIVTINSGESLKVDFRNGGGHNGQNCAFALGTNDQDAASFGETIVNVPNCPSPFTSSETVPINVPAGTWYLQWTWNAGGNPWASCVQLNVLDPLITLIEVEPSVTTTGTRSTNATYYKIPLDAYDSERTNVFVNVMNKGTSQISASVSATSIPMDVDDGIVLQVDPSESLNAPICLGGNSEFAYLTVHPGAEAEYEFSVEPYDAYLDVVDSSKNTVDVKAGSMIYFFTPSTSQEGKSRRIQFTGAGYQNCFASGPYPDSCQNYQKPEDYEQTRCINLPKANNNVENNYFALECTEDFSGTVEIARGSCSDFEDSGSAELVVMLAMIVLCLLF